MIRVYLVDDEASILNWLHTAIDWVKFDCSVCGMSQKALTALDFLKDNKVDLLITDIGIPDMDGLSLVREAKKLQSHIQILIISAHSDFDYAKQAVRLGAIDYLLKPLSKSELSEALARISTTIGNHVNSEIDDFKLFQNNVLQHWVRGSNIGSDFIEQATLAKIDLNSERFSVFILCTEQLVSASALKVYHLCSETSIPGCIGIFLDTTMNIVGILSGDSSENETALTALLLRLNDSTEKSLCIIVGKTVFQYLQVTDSYDSAYNFRNSLLFLQSQLIFAERYPSPLALLKQPGFRLVLSYLEHDNVKDALGAARTLAARFSSSGNEYDRGVLLSLMLALINENPNTGLPAGKEIRTLAGRFENEICETWLPAIFKEFAGLCKNQFMDMHPYIRKSLQWISEEYGSPLLGLGLLAERLKVTPVYLGQLFFSQTGMYFNDYLTDYRLKEVCSLLDTTDIRIGDIAKAVGFSSQSYLNRVFRKKYRISPMGYRLK